MFVMFLICLLQICATSVKWIYRAVRYRLRPNMQRPRACHQLPTVTTGFACHVAGRGRGTQTKMPIHRAAHSCVGQ